MRFKQRRRRQVPAGVGDTLLDFREAVGRNQVGLHMQPIVSATGRIAGHEALIRWFPSGEPLKSPASWIPVAEREGWIVEVDRWVLREAGSHLRRTAASDDLLSVNISAGHLTSGSLAATVALAIDGVVNPGRLVLEVTEGTPITDLVTAAATLRAVRSLGVQVAMDDFGAGNTSVRALRRLPLDIVKIDRSFTQNIEHEIDRSLLRLVVEAARVLDLTVILEGIETPQQWQHAKDLGIDLYQGYLFGRPTPWVQTDSLNLTNA